jgi:hypothetical protein
VLLTLSDSDGYHGLDFNPHALDMALHQVLRKFAINPDKIALAGHCRSGWVPVVFGAANRDIFNRLLVISTSETKKTFDALGPSDGRIEFFLDDGFLETEWMYRRAHLLRAAGYPVTHMVSIRRHSSIPENADVMGKWLQDSWTLPNPARRPKPNSIGSLPLLTDDAIKALSTFWVAFQQLPDSIVLSARRQHQRTLLLPIGDDSPVTSMVDMAVLAKQYPAVASALAAAGLTAEQHDRYRIALLEALIAQGFESVEVTVPVRSVQAQNLAFVREHRDELTRFAIDTKIWDSP